jgi:hypothetical protein
VLLTFIAMGGVGAFFASIRPTVEPDLKALRSLDPPTGRTVRITCDRVEGPVWEETDRHGDPTSQIALCALGRYYLPIKLDDDDAIPATVVEGKLFHISDRDLWVRDGLRKEPELDAQSLDVFVDAKKRGDDAFMAAFGIAMALSAPVGWFFYVRWRRRMKAQLAKIT